MQRGQKKVEIVKITEYDPSIISKFLKRFAVRKLVENNTRSGRPKLTSVQSDRLLNMLVLKDRRQNLSDLTSKFNSLTSKPLSKRSVHRISHYIQY